MCRRRGSIGEDERDYNAEIGEDAQQNEQRSPLNGSRCGRTSTEGGEREE